MKIMDAITTYYLPGTTTQEDLELRWKRVLRYNDKVILVGEWHADGKDCFFAAIYQHLEADLAVDGLVKLVAASEAEFSDDGHAVAWAIKQC